ncbi:MAG: iron-containing alcohol dehydrogenase [Candidatus Aenigmatarchaeota archaeon]
MIINLPYKILIDRSVDGKIVDFLRSMNLGKNVLITCGPNVKKKVGTKIMKILSESFRVGMVTIETTEKNYIENLAEKISGFDFVVGLGGGRSIDIAKYASFLAKKPWIAFPTTLSHDGVVSSRASINHNGDRISIDAIEPIAIIADLDIIKKSSYRNIAAGAGDVISNISSVEDWKIAAKRNKERYHTLMAELSLLSARAVIEHIDDIKKKNYHGLEILLWSLICSGFAMNIYCSSRPCSGSEHNFSHALDRIGTKAMHGEQCALGTIIMAYLQKKDWKSVREHLIRLGLPTNAKEIGIGEETLAMALVNARKIRERYTILNEKNITRDEARKILKEVKII